MDTKKLIAKFFKKNPEVFTIVNTCLFYKKYFYKVCPACAANVKPNENNYLTLRTIKHDVAYMHCKKRLAIFPSPAGMALPNSSWPEIIFIIHGQGE
jgi:hypothetical protein